MAQFDRAGDILATQDAFQNNEVGVTHPDNPSFMKLNDNGDIEIFASEGLGIMIDRNSRAIVLVADTVKFLTKEHEGLRWNRLAFNEEATEFQEPAFIQMTDDDMYNLYRGTDPYLFGGGTVNKKFGTS